MKKKSKKTIKQVEYTGEQIKENCIIEFLCSLTDKPVFSIKMLIDKIKSFFKS